MRKDKGKIQKVYVVRRTSLAPQLLPHSFPFFLILISIIGVAHLLLREATLFGKLDDSLKITYNFMRAFNSFSSPFSSILPH